MLTRFKAEFPNDMVFSMLVHQLFEKYPEGFYVHMPEESRITNTRKIAKYVARYIRHPAVANTRLHKYDGKLVTFWYKDDKGVKHFVTMEVHVFIPIVIPRTSAAVGCDVATFDLHPTGAFLFELTTMENRKY